MAKAAFGWAKFGFMLYSTAAKVYLIICIYLKQNSTKQSCMLVNFVIADCAGFPHTHKLVWITEYVNHWLWPWRISRGNSSHCFLWIKGSKWFLCCTIEGLWNQVRQVSLKWHCKSLVAGTWWGDYSLN